MTPPYLTELIPPSFADTTTYRLRHSHQIRNVHCKSHLFSNSFLPSTISLWNNLPASTRHAPSLQAFRTALNNNVRKTPQHYYLGNRSDCIQHARLRMHCSSLKEHLFTKNIVDDPMCICGSIEDTYHFFFNCPLYSNQRRILLHNLSNVPNINLHLLLFGDTGAPLHTNNHIFQQVHKYIVSTKRFTY